MTALAATDVTVTVDDYSRVIGSRGKREHNVTITFGDGAKTYPANGVPLPVPANGVGGMGLARALELLLLYDSNNAGDGLIYDYDSVHNTIRIYFPTQQTAGAGNRAGTEVTAAFVPAAATTLYGRVRGV